MTKTNFVVHTPESAPVSSRSALLGLKERFGLIPNLAATMAESPTLLNGFVGALTNFSAGTFDGGQRQALLLTNAVANRCAWAVAFHSTAALGEGVAAADLQAVREGRLPAEPKLAALSAFTRALIEQRGHANDRDLGAFLAAGFTPAQAFEVIAGLACSVMANYAGNLASPPLEAPFSAHAWTSA